MMEEAKALPKRCRQVGSAFTSFIQATRVPARVVQSNFVEPGSVCCAFLFLLILLISLLFLELADVSSLPEAKSHDEV